MKLKGYMRIMIVYPRFIFLVLFSYGLELLESDIDLAILFKDEVLYDEKEKVINEVKEDILKRLNRYGDVIEIMSEDKDYLKHKLQAFEGVKYE